MDQRSWLLVAAVLAVSAVGVAGYEFAKLPGGAIAVAIPLLFSFSIRAFKYLSVEALAVLIMATCAFGSLTASLVLIVAGALLVGVGYLSPLSLLEWLAADGLLLMAYYWVKSGRTPLALGSLFSCASIVVFIAYGRNT
jgi:hypothetical protein